jgi:hypothetical protein
LPGKVITGCYIIELWMEHNRDNTLDLNYVAINGDLNLSRCIQLPTKPYLVEFRMGKINPGVTTARSM